MHSNGTDNFQTGKLISSAVERMDEIPERETDREREREKTWVSLFIEPTFAKKVLQWCFIEQQLAHFSPFDMVYLMSFFNDVYMDLFLLIFYFIPARLHLEYI